jgi:hypothetical protein
MAHFRNNYRFSGIILIITTGNLDPFSLWQSFLMALFILRMDFKFEKTMVKIHLLGVNMTRTFYLLILSIVFFILLLPPNGFGDERKLTLTEAIKIALEENYELRAAKNAVSAQKEGVGSGEEAGCHSLVRILVWVTGSSILPARQWSI